MLGHEVTAATAARACPTTRSTSRSPAPPARASARSSRGRHAAPRGRRQRLRRQGPLRRPRRRPPPTASDVRRRGTSSSPATSSATAPPAARFLRGVVGERFCVRNSGRHRRRRGRGRPRLRVHDRRPVVVSGRPAATSRRACPAASPTSDPTRRRPGSTPMVGRPRPAVDADDDVAPAAPRLPAPRETGSTVAAGLSADPAFRQPVHQGDARDYRRVLAFGPGRGRARKAGTHRGDHGGDPWLTRPGAS